MAPWDGLPWPCCSWLPRSSPLWLLLVRLDSCVWRRLPSLAADPAWKNMNWIFAGASTRRTDYISALLIHLAGAPQTEVFRQYGFGPVGRVARSSSRRDYGGNNAHRGYPEYL